MKDCDHEEKEVVCFDFVVIRVVIFSRVPWQTSKSTEHLLSDWPIYKPFQHLVYASRQHGRVYNPQLNE